MKVRVPTTTDRLEVGLHLLDDAVDVSQQCVLSGPRRSCRSSGKQNRTTGRENRTR
jgi:hypothetical protein